MRFPRSLSIVAIPLVLVVSAVPCVAQRGRAGSPFPGGENPDGSLRPSARNSRLFTQDAYTEYTLLAPGSEEFRIRYLPEVTRVGATELVNATRGGSEGTDIEVYDPRTGKPLPFTYEAERGGHAIHAKLTAPVPSGGMGRVLIYKTYKDARTYQVYNDANPAYGIEPGDITWVRSLSGYRLGVILPPGYALLSSSIATQISTTPDGRIALHFANPSGLGNPFTIHARRAPASFTPKPTPYTDMFFDDVKTLYDLDQPAAHSARVEQIYSDYRKGSVLPLELLTYASLDQLKVVDLDTAEPLATAQREGRTVVELALPIVDDRQSAHLQVSGILTDPGYREVNGVLTFDRELHGLRNTILLPEGWEVTSVSQSGTVGVYRGRVYVALINLNSENKYRVVITATRR